MWGGARSAGGFLLWLGEGEGCQGWALGAAIDPASGYGPAVFRFALMLVHFETSRRVVREAPACDAFGDTFAKRSVFAPDVRLSATERSFVRRLLL